jgi:hypothetical protein
VLDPVAGDVEREHRDGGPVNLRDQAGLAVRSRSVAFPGVRLASSTQARAICSPPSMGRNEGRGQVHVPELQADLDIPRSSITRAQLKLNPRNATGSVTLGDGTAYDDLPLVIVNELIP